MAAQFTGFAMQRRVAISEKGRAKMKDITAKTFEGAVLKSVQPVVVVIWGVG